ncbi:MAG: hypothetical protein WCF67_25520, partial [Chitinophagaceae bacterium]
MRFLRKALWVCLIAYSFTAAAQNPAPVIQLQKCIGGLGIDAFLSMGPSSDGGSFITASTASSGIFNCDGDVVMKVDSAGNIQWRQCFFLVHRSLINANTEGYLSIGTVSSANYNVGVFRHDNTTGAIISQRLYGGSGDDLGKQIIRAGDGGYIFLAESESMDGDVEANNTLRKPWIVHISEAGDIIWKVTLEKNAATNIEVVKLIQTQEGGYALLSTTSNGQNKDSIWIVKLSATGEKTWERSFLRQRNSFSAGFEQTSDGGFIIASEEKLPAPSTSDIRLWRFNSDGSFRWSAVHGTSYEDFPRSLAVDLDGNFIVSGGYTGPRGDLLGSHGADAFLMKLPDSPTGSVIWAKAFGGSSGENFGKIYIRPNGQIVAAGAANSNDGDVSGYHGHTDVWFVVMRMSNIVHGTVFIDNNANGIRDAGDSDANNFLVRSEKPGHVSESITFKGKFINEADTGITTTSIRLNNSYYNVVPASHSVTFSTFQNKDSISFALQPSQVVDDCGIAITSLGRVRPGFETSYLLYVKNSGTKVLANKMVSFIKDRMAFQHSTLSPSAVNGDTIRWMIPSLNPNDTMTIQVWMLIDQPPSVSINSVLRLKAAIDSAGDVNSADNLSVLLQVARDSYDPNDKLENSGQYITRSEVLQRKTLNYAIRFQNTGNDTAINVTIMDTLDSKLELSSLEMGAVSHAYTLRVKDGNKLIFTFNNIMLPDSNVNEPASHGFISYRIKTRNNLQVGDTIKNTAFIYFNFNPAVATNVQKTIVTDNFALPVQLLTFYGNVTNHKVVLIWKTARFETGDVFEIERSTNGTDFQKIGSVNVARVANSSDYTFDDNAPTNGLNYYRLKMLSVDGSITYSSIIAIEFVKKSEIYLTVYPN